MQLQLSHDVGAMSLSSFDADAESDSYFLATFAFR